ENALVNGLAREELATLLEALLAAFGPLGATPRARPEVARLCQELWQRVTPRADRRLRELCADPSQITISVALEGTKQAMRRAGLFACGSLSIALTRAANDLGVLAEDLDPSSDALQKTCDAHAEIA